MAHIASLSQLQVPEFASVNGELVPYSDVKFHISAEALTRGLSIFEGIKAYWDSASTSLAVRTLELHYARLCESAQLLHIPVTFDYDTFRKGVSDLIGALAKPKKDIWVRTTLYVSEGHWGEGTVADLVMTGILQTKEPIPPFRIGVSTWRRSPDDSMPARIKCAANYQVSRMARIEGRSRGLDDMVLLNSSGRVAEGTGSCIVIVRNGQVISPPPSEGALESITLDVVRRVCGALDVPFVTRPIDRSELVVASEIALVGTISEVTLVAEAEERVLRTDGILAEVQASYMRIMRRDEILPGVNLAPVAQQRSSSG